jgi:hypothetical protein
MTDEGAPGVGQLNPFVQTEAETIGWESGVETEPCSEGGMNVTSIDDGDFIEVKGVDFGAGADSFEARVASAGGGGSIELHLDGPTGTLVGTCSVASTGGAQTWVTVTCPVSGATGLHDLHFSFTGGGGPLFGFDWWRFDGPGRPATGAAGAASTDAGSGGEGGSAGGGGAGVELPATAGVGGAQGGASGTVGGSGGAAAAAAPVAAAGGSAAGAGGAGVAAQDDVGEPDSSSSAGCACRSGPARGHLAHAAPLLLLALAARRRRQRRRARREDARR